MNASQSQFLVVLDRDTAAARFAAALNLAPLPEECVPLAQALGRVLARDVRAPCDVPAFDRANVDGYALRAADVAGARELAPIGLPLVMRAIATGVPPQEELPPGMARGIATGGMIPRGATAVVMVEHTELRGNQLEVKKSLVSGAGITFAGTDMAAGETVLRAGERLTSRETGVLAALGCSLVWVRPRPRVAILSTGNELTAPGQSLPLAHVFDSNLRMLADAVREQGGEPCELGIVPDNEAALRTALRQALPCHHLVLISGGTSKGEGDISYRVVSELGEPGVVAHGVALKPGKPICLAATQGKGVVVLPGFPTSAIFTFHEFVAPVLRRLAGWPQQSPHAVPARLAVTVNSEIGRTEFLLVGLVPAADAAANQEWVAFPLGKGSGSVTTFSQADGFVTIGRHEEQVAAGTPVTVQMLGGTLEPPQLAVVGSHCVGLDLLLGHLHRQGIRARMLAVGSTAGLAAARQAECDLAGIHLLDAATGSYNRPFVTPELELIPGYSRPQGLVFRPGDARFQNVALAEFVAVATRDARCRMVNRNAGSGTRVLLDELLAGARPPGYEVQPRSHQAVVAAVAQGRADWGLAIEPVARQAGLAFLPVRVEQFDFVTPGARAGRRPVIAFRELLASPEVRRELATLGFQVAGTRPE